MEYGVYGVWSLEREREREGQRLSAFKRGGLLQRPGNHDDAEDDGGGRRLIGIGELYRRRTGGRDGGEEKAAGIWGGGNRGSRG